jgi:hypothetical protein
MYTVGVEGPISTIFIINNTCTIPADELFGEQNRKDAGHQVGFFCSQYACFPVKRITSIKEFLNHIPIKKTRAITDVMNTPTRQHVEGNGHLLHKQCLSNCSVPSFKLELRKLDVSPDEILVTNKSCHRNIVTNKSCHRK